jgi:hypothetical protein
MIAMRSSRRYWRCESRSGRDIDWYGFVRRDYKTERTGDLWFDEGGAGNDFAEIYIRDEKNGNQRRPLSEATLRDGSVLGWCSGRSPWLGPRPR